MGTIGIIKKFIESSWIVEKAVRETIERLPMNLRYGICYGPTFRHWLALLRESEQWDSNRLADYQVEQLRDLLIYAGKYVPYYRKMFREYGFNPQKVQDYDDIRVLPFIRKETLRDEAHLLVAEHIPRSRLIELSTGGSTGIPVKVYGTKDAEEKHWATVVDLWSRIGYHPNARTVSFYHNITLGKRNFMPFKKYANQLIISRNFFEKPWLKRFIEMIKEFRPRFICGLPSHLAFFSAFMEGQGELPIEGVKAILTYSEGATLLQRKVIERAFGARLFTSYGMVEKAIYGGACEHSDGLHIYPQYGIAENEYDSLGNAEIIATGFINYAMPIIRYRTMDVGRIVGSCNQCGRAYQLIAHIEGRTGDFLVDRHGNIISIIGVGTRSKCFFNVKMYQFYQGEKGKAILKIVRNHTYSEADTARIWDELHKKLGIRGNITLKLEFVEDVQRTSSGKTKVIIQKLGRAIDNEYHN